MRNCGLWVPSPAHTILKLTFGPTRTELDAVSQARWGTPDLCLSLPRFKPHSISSNFLAYFYSWYSLMIFLFLVPFWIIHFWNPTTFGCIFISMTLVMCWCSGRALHRSSWSRQRSWDCISVSNIQLPVECFYLFSSFVDNAPFSSWDLHLFSNSLRHFCQFKKASSSRLHAEVDYVAWTF